MKILDTILVFAMTRIATKTPTDQAPIGHRIAAFGINFLLFSVISQAVQEFNEETIGAILGSACLVALPFICSLFPESIGKRFMNLRIIKLNGESIGLMTRIKRSIPYLLIFLAVACINLKEIGLPGNMPAIFGVPFIVYFFVNLSVFFINGNHSSIVDLWLGTRVSKKPRLPESLEPTFFGMKIK